MYSGSTGCTLRSMAPGAILPLAAVTAAPLELEAAGRTIARDGDAGRSRWADVGGIQRVELPGGGRLLRYVRLAGQFYGFLHIAAGGAATVSGMMPSTSHI